MVFILQIAPEAERGRKVEGTLAVIPFTKAPFPDPETGIFLTPP